jgi:FeS assembly protein IscX
MGLRWTDVTEIAIALDEAHPDVDPLRVNFVDLMRQAMALPEFDDREDRCGEKILEAIQAAWIEERE